MNKQLKSMQNFSKYLLLFLNVFISFSCTWGPLMYEDSVYSARLGSFSITDSETGNPIEYIEVTYSSYDTNHSDIYSDSNGIVNYDISIKWGESFVINLNDIDGENNGNYVSKIVILDDDDETLDDVTLEKIE